MDAKLERVIELVSQLQEAMKECDCVLGYNFSKFPGISGGIHVYEPDKLGLSGLELDFTDLEGNDWVRASIVGVDVYGRVLREAVSDEST